MRKTMNITKLFATLMIVFSTSAFAEPLKIILPGSETGSFNTRFQMLKSDIEDAYGDLAQLVFADNCTRAHQMLENETGPAITIWQAVFNVYEECKLDTDTIDVLALETNPLRICASTNSGRTAQDLFLPDNTFSVGHSDPHQEYRVWLQGFNLANGVNLQPVPYDSSGDARRGALAGDVDFVFISPSNSNKLMKNGGQCFYTTNSQGEEKYNLPALNTVTDYKYADIQQTYYYAGFNLTDEQIVALQEVFSRAADPSSQFSEFALTKDITLRGIESFTSIEMNTLVNDTIRLATK